MVLFDKFYLCFSSCNSKGVEEIEMELITPDINEDAVERVLEGDKKQKEEARESKARAKPKKIWTPHSGNIWQPMAQWTLT